MVSYDTMEEQEDICLSDELARHKGKTVFIGVRSSFFFIGPSEEASHDLVEIGLMARCCVPLSAHKDITRFLKRPPEDIGRRKVLKTYVRNPDYGDDEIVILVEGKEFGAFWTREEYLAGMRELSASMGNLPPEEPVKP